MKVSDLKLRPGNLVGVFGFGAGHEDLRDRGRVSMQLEIISVGSYLPRQNTISLDYHIITDTFTFRRNRFTYILGKLHYECW